MSFTNNLVYLREHYNMTQEELAEKLQVSRQTISKWESGVNFPEMDKVLQICELYNTSLDDLLRGSVKITNQHDTELYDKHMTGYSWAITLGTGIVIFAASAIIALDSIGLSGNISTALFLTMIAIAAVIFITSGMNHSNFKKRHADIAPDYPQQVRDSFMRVHTFRLVAGIAILCLALIMLILFVPEEDDFAHLGSVAISVELIMTGFLWTIAVGVMLIIFTCMQKAKYDLDEIEAVTPQELKKRHYQGIACGAIMILATAVFFAWGFTGGGIEEISSMGNIADLKNTLRSGFAISWIAFVIGGLLCSVACLIISAIVKEPDTKIIDEAKKENPWLKVEEDDE